MSTAITCKSCGSNVVPKLWSYGGGFFKYSTMQHICPFCGNVLYETGGQSKGILKFLKWLFVVLAVGYFIPQKFQGMFFSYGLTFLCAYWVVVRPIMIFAQGFMSGYKGK